MRRTTATAMLGLALALTGCGIVPGAGPDPRVEATPVATVTCPETYGEGHAEAGLVPADFTPIAVLRCDPYDSREDAAGVWSGALLERLEGDLEPVLAALATPSDARSLGWCTAVGFVLPELWMEGADRTVVRVAVPSDGCGAPKAVGLEAALDALTVVDEGFVAASLVESAAATDAGCATQAGVLIIAGLEDASGLGEVITPDEGSLLDDDALVPFEMPGWPDSSAVNGARLCDYVATPLSTSSPAPAGDGGVFVGARELTSAAAQAIVSDARLAPAAAFCTAMATRLVVVHPKAEAETPPPSSSNSTDAGDSSTPRFSHESRQRSFWRLWHPRADAPSGAARALNERHPAPTEYDGPRCQAP